MRKLFLFAITTVLIAPDAWAVCMAWGDKPYDCSAMGFSNCCAANAASCASTCGTIITPPVSSCPSACPYTTSYTSASGNRSARCAKLADGSARCVYICNSGYFALGLENPFFEEGSPISVRSVASCVACPSNATCSGGTSTSPVCNQNYYRSGSDANQKCNACPAQKVDSSCAGTYPGTVPPSLEEMYVGFPGKTDGTGKTSITACYMDPGHEFCDSSGWYTYTGNCKYVN